MSSIKQRPAEGNDNDWIKYSVVIPVYGSVRILSELHARLSSVLIALGEPYEIVFVDDCGPGNAWQIMEALARKDQYVTAIQLMLNSGQSNATLCGMAHAHGEVVITMDDDLQHPPEEIPRLLEALRPDVDVVMGVPFEKQHNLVRRLGSQMVNEINTHLLGKERELRFTSFRVIRRPVVDGLLQLRNWNPALGPLINSITHRIINVNVLHSPRSDGKSGYTFSLLLSQTMNNLIGHSMLPLRLLGLIGGIGIVISVTFSVVLVIRYIVVGVGVPGWTTTTLLLLLLSGFNFFAFAIIGEYVLRVLERVNSRPQYVLRSMVSGKNIALDKEFRKTIK